MRFNSPKIVVTTILAALITVALAWGAVAAPPWSDAPAAWWVSSYGVTEAKVATVADGYPDGTFKPSLAVTRGQFAKMAVSGLGVATVNPAVPTFKDVGRGGTFYTYVEGAYAAGLIGGYPAGGGGLHFRPANTITRQQANSILARYLSKLEIDTTGAIHGDVTNYGTLALWYNAEGEFYLKAFSDWTKVAADHRATTAYLIRRGIVKGANSRLNPTATLIRAQAAALVLRVKDEATDILTPPTPPTNLGVVATGVGMTVFQTGPTSYMGNDPTPRVTGDTLPNSNTAVYDAPFYGTTYIKLDKSNLSGKFYTDLDEPTKPLVDGTHSFTAKVMNANGLVSAASEPVTYVLDRVAPTGSITAPVRLVGEDFAAVNSAKPAFTVSATDERSGIKSVAFQVADDAPSLEWQTISTDTVPETDTTIYAAVWPATGSLGLGLKDGRYQLRAVVTDNAGNQRILGPLTVLVDTVAPVVTITAPLANLDSRFYTESSTPTFEADASDPEGLGGAGTASGLAKVEFFYALGDGARPTTWEGFTRLSSDETAPYAAVYSAGLPQGRYIFAVRATDKAGNQSVLMNGAEYRAGVTQEVVIDNAPPVVVVTAPKAGDLVSSGSTLTIKWTLTDVSAPESVKIECSIDNGASWTLITTAAPFTPGSAGSYDWTVGNLDPGSEIATYKVRITAVDKAGGVVGNIAGHTTVQESGTFTVYGPPLPATNIVGKDEDDEVEGVDGRDFSATWTVSASTHVSWQKVYLLPAGENLDLGATPAPRPVATYSNNTTATWTGAQTLTKDSQDRDLAVGNYRVWIVVTDKAGRTAKASSEAFGVNDP